MGKHELKTPLFSARSHRGDIFQLNNRQRQGYFATRSLERNLGTNPCSARGQRNSALRAITFEGFDIRTAFERFRDRVSKDVSVAVRLNAQASKRGGNWRSEFAFGVDNYRLDCLPDMGNHAPCGTEQAVVNSDGRVSMYFVTNMGRSFQAGDNGQEASSRANGKDQEGMARIFISCRRAISITRLPSLTALSLPLRAEIRHDRNGKSGDVYFIESAIRRMCSRPQVTFFKKFLSGSISK